MEALTNRHSYFHSHGCRMSDISIDAFYVEDYTAPEIDEIVVKIIQGKPLSVVEQNKLKAALLISMCELDYKAGWVQQYHVGVQADLNTTMFKLLGRHSGFDGMNENVDEIESIGSIEEIDGKMYYVSDSTNNGFCYKDAKAYNNEPDKICYLSEGAFDESEDGKIAVDYVEANKERLVDWGSADTKNSIREQVRTMFEEEEYWYESDSGEKIEAKDFDDELVDQIADDAFSMVDWQSVNGFLLEREWDEAVEEYYDKKFGTLKEAAKPKKKKAKKDEKDEKRVVMQQGNVTCFKENDSKYLVFENESDNEKEYSDQDSAMEDFMSRVGIDTDRKLKESVIVAGNKIPIRKRPTKK